MSRQGDIDRRAQAELAMKMAAATTGFERLKWVRIALAWHDLETAGERLEIACKSKGPVS